MMSKRSNRGKAYFYAMGQRECSNGVFHTSQGLSRKRKKLADGIGWWAYNAWFDGYWQVPF